MMPRSVPVCRPSERRLLSRAEAADVGSSAAVQGAECPSRFGGTRAAEPATVSVVALALSVGESPVMDDLHALDLATQEFERCLAKVRPDQLGLPTPCDEWDVRYLIAHVVGGNRFATLAPDGITEAASDATEQTEKALGVANHDSA